MSDRNLKGVLKKASKKELKPLVDLLDKKSADWSVNKKWTLTRLRKEVEQELRLNGGHAMINPFRGEGPSWREIVENVADKMKVTYSERESISKIELKVLAKALDKRIAKMNPQQRAKLKRNIVKLGLPKDMPIAGGAILAGVIAGNIAGFAPYKGIVVFANLAANAIAGGGLAVVNNILLVKGLHLFLGPVGWIISALSIVIQIGGPAYRITIPSVIIMSLLRSQQKIALAKN